MFVKFILKENNDAYCRRLLHVCGTITKLYMVHCTLWVTLFCQEGCRRKKEKKQCNLKKHVLVLIARKRKNRSYDKYKWWHYVMFRLLSVLKRFLLLTNQSNFYSESHVRSYSYMERYGRFYMYFSLCHASFTSMPPPPKKKKLWKINKGFWRVLLDLNWKRI